MLSNLLYNAASRVQHEDCRSEVLVEGSEERHRMNKRLASEKLESGLGHDMRTDTGDLASERLASRLGRDMRPDMAKLYSLVQAVGIVAAAE